MIRFFTGHRTAANLLMLTFLVLGALAVRDILRESLPDITPTEIEVSVRYPGASAREVEDSVLSSLEDAVDGVRFIEEVRAEAREGMGRMIIEMREDGDFQTFKNDIESEIDAIDNLPREAEEPIITQLGTTEQVLAILVIGRMTATDLKSYCDALKQRLQALPAISLVEVFGFSEHQMRICLSAEALLQYDLSSTDIVNMIRRQSINSPVGTIETADREILLRFVEERRTPEEFRKLVVKSAAGGAEIRLDDIAEIHDTFEQAEEKIVYRGERAGKIVISKTKTEDSLRIAEAVHTFLEQEQARQPNISLFVTEDSSQALKDRLSLVITNGWQGIILVFLMMWLFFRFNVSFWVVMGLPVSFFGAFALMPQFGLTINLMTLVGFLLALGILMDDAIVIAENIMTHLHKGKDAIRAAADGVLEVKNGILASFLTTVCILGPLSFISGDIGKLLRVVPMILILVLAVSLIEAFFILPAHLAHTLHAHKENNRNRFRRWFERSFETFRHRYLGRALDRVIEARYLFLGAVAGTLLITAGTIASGILAFQALPKLEGNVIVARVLMPPGTSLARTEAVTDQLLAGLEKMNNRLTPAQPGKKPLVLGAYAHHNFNIDAHESGPHVATITVDLLTAEERSGRIDEYLRLWRKQTGPIPDAISVTMDEAVMEPAGRAIEIRLQGQELAELKNAVLEVRQWFTRFVGVNNLLEDLRQGKEELHLTAKQGALGLGLDVETMARQLRSAFQGATADEMQIDGNAYNIDVLLQEQLKNSLEDLNAFHFITPEGQTIPLPAAIDISTARGWSAINHVDGRRTVTLRGDVNTAVANSAQLIDRFRTEFLPILAKRYPDVRVSFEGQEKNAKTTRKSIILGTLIGLIGVYILLSFQFGNYREPFVIMTIIPCTLIGVVIGHLVMGMPFTLPSLLGFISLAGIVVNDSILLVLFIKKQMGKGMEIAEAAGRASRSRSRAVILTSTSTIAGLLPLLFETSLQAQIIQPLAISIGFGLMASTVLVLFVIPCIYVLLDDLGIRFN